MRKSDFIRDGHKMYWVIENGELVENSVIHPDSCDREKCNIAHEEEYQFLNEDTLTYQTPPPWNEQGEDGAFEVEIEHYYCYFKPCYPDYEPDYEFEWHPVGEVSMVTFT